MKTDLENKSMSNEQKIAKHSNNPENSYPNWQNLQSNFFYNQEIQTDKYKFLINQLPEGIFSDYFLP